MLYQIGIFSQMAKTTIKTLRFYDREGLLAPAHTDAETGYRYYLGEQLYTLHEIQSLRQMGFSIAQIKQLLSGQHTADILAQREHELAEERRLVEERMFRLHHYMEKRREEMKYQAVMKDIPECIVFSRRVKIPNYDAMMTMVPETGRKISAANPDLKCALPEYCFNIYHDGEYRETDIDVEICEAVERIGNEVDDIKFKTCPPVTVVSAMHKGPYRTLGLAYAFLTSWIEQNGYEMTDNPRESFIDGIWNKDSEEDWLTEVQIPVKKASEK